MTNSDGWEGFFTAFRDPGAPTLYGSARTAVTVDVLEIGFVFAALILTLSFLLTLLGIRGCGQVNNNQLSETEKRIIVHE